MTSLPLSLVDGDMEDTGGGESLHSQLVGSLDPVGPKVRSDFWRCSESLNERYNKCLGSRGTIFNDI